MEAYAIFCQLVQADVTVFHCEHGIITGCNGQCGFEGGNFLTDVFLNLFFLIQLIDTLSVDGREWTVIQIPVKAIGQIREEAVVFIAGQAVYGNFIMSIMRVDDFKIAYRQVFPIQVIIGAVIFFGNIIQRLLDAIVDFLPAPTDVPSITGKNPRVDRDEVRHPGDDEPFSALVFKILTDEYVGKLAFIRIYSGTIKTGMMVFNPGKNENERIGRILRMNADDREDLTEAGAGDIVALVGLKKSTTGDTLCDKSHQIVLENMVFPEPVIKVAIEPKTKASQERMNTAIMKLQEEDPTFKAYTDKDTGQIIIAGMGELHLEIIVDRMFREFRVEANVGKPQVSYRETITRPSKAEGKFVRQTGGHGQYGHCVIELEPNPGGGYEFSNETVGGVVPKEFANAVSEGIKEAAKAGIMAGYEVVDFKVRLVDGSTHEVDSSEMAFRVAGSMAFRNAAEKAKPILLEPIMKVEIDVPDEYVGDVMSNLNSRRGSVRGMEMKNGIQAIESDVPLSEMFGYATTLRSITQGRATFTMLFDHYAEVPQSIAEKVTGKKFQR